MDKKKLKVALEAFNVSFKYPEHTTAQYIKENVKVRQREKMWVEEEFHFVVFGLDDGCLCAMFAWL